MSLLTVTAQLQQYSELISVDEYECPSSPTSLTNRTLFLHFLEDDNDSIKLILEDDNLIALLEDTILDTYNNQSFVSCDLPHFRGIRSVTHLALESHNTLDDYYYPHTDSQDKRPTVVVAFQVEAECRNCTDSLELFPFHHGPANHVNDPSDPEALLAQPTSTARIGSHNPSSRQGDAESCVCPVNGQPNPNLLTPEELLPILNQNLQGSTGLPLLTTDSLTELRSIHCGDPEDLQTFTSLVYVTVEIEIDEEPSTQELEELQNVFLDTYNRLAFEACDPHAKTITGVALEIQCTEHNVQQELFLEHQESRFLQSTNATGDSLWNMAPSSAPSLAPSAPTTKSATAVFTIQGQCQNNCPVSKSGSLSLFQLDATQSEFPSTTRHLQQKGKGPGLFESAVIQQQHRRLQDSTSSCLCPITGDPQKGVTETSFLGSLQQEIDILQQQGDVEAIQEAVDLQEATVVSCMEQETEFQSIVFSDLRVNITELTPEDANMLEEAFRETYNRLAFATCDGYFRTVVNVELRVASEDGMFNNQNEEGRRLEDVLMEMDDVLQRLSNHSDTSTPNNTAGFGNSTIPQRDDRNRGIVPTVFAVTGTCRGCPVTEAGAFNLFDDTFNSNRRLLATDSPTDRAASSSLNFQDWSSLTRQLQDETADSCICQAGTEPTIGNGPSAQEFELEINNEIGQLDGAVEAIETSAENIVEGQPVLCDGEIREFSSSVYADIGVDPNDLSKQTIQTLERVFQDTYNSLSFDACDEFFRVVSKVALLVDNSRRLQDQEPEASNGAANSTNYTSTDDRPRDRILFEVAGRCRNCPVTDAGSFNLFDDTLRRALGQTRELYSQTTRFSNHTPTYGSSVGGRRHLQQALDVCLCPIGKEPDDVSNTTTSDFLVEYNSNLVIAQKEAAQEADLEIPMSTSEANSTDTEPSPEVTDTVSVIVIEEVPVDPTLPKNLTDTPSPTPQPTSIHPTTGSPTLNATFPTPLPTTVQPTTGSPTLNATFPTPLPTTVQSTTGYPTPNATFNPPPPVTATPTRLARVEVRLTAEPTTASPSSPPSRNPTEPPTQEPTPEPTNEPTLSPTPLPTLDPTNSPTSHPSAHPTTVAPTTLIPTSVPSMQPSVTPSQFPTPAPTWEPTDMPTNNPTNQPSESPSSQPSLDPTDSPSMQPTQTPYHVPTVSPSVSPSNPPTQVLCSLPFQSVTAELSITLSGDSTALTDEYLISTMLVASQNSVTNNPCAPQITSASIQSRVLQRRRLQGSVSSEIILYSPLGTLQVTPGEMYQDWFLTALVGGYNGALLGSGVTAVGAQQPTNSPSSLPSLSPSSTPSGPPSSYPSAKPSTIPSVVPSLRPSFSPSLLPSAQPSGLPSFRPSVSQEPSGSPNGSPSEEPSTPPTSSPSTSPSVTPSANPSTMPFFVPTKLPTPAPMEVPTPAPTKVPTKVPTPAPTKNPTSLPTKSPTGGPTKLPTASPTNSPTLPPTMAPTTATPTTSSPSKTPTASPTKPPTETPTLSPTSLPTTLSPTTLTPTTATPTVSTGNPSGSPTTANPTTSLPSKAPTKVPTRAPTQVPTKSPSLSPTSFPTKAPTFSPTIAPTILNQFTLVNTDADLQVRTLVEGETLDVGMLGYNYNIVAFTEATGIDHVDLYVDGSLVIREDFVPYALCSDNFGDYYPCTSSSFTYGSITIEAKSYDASDIETDSITINLTILDSSTPAPTMPPTAAPTEVPTKEPTEAPTEAPTNAPTEAPTKAPTESPTESPTKAPTESPTKAPTESPTRYPTRAPTEAPTKAPTVSPTEPPSETPTKIPTEQPTKAPTAPPTAAPTEAPTASPTESPTQAPTEVPTKAPTKAPTAAPTNAPTESPTKAPTEAPTKSPTEAPTNLPTKAPTGTPTKGPTETPTKAPTDSPTVAPTILSHFTLVNADSNTQVRSLVEGETFDRSALGYNYNIAAFTESTGIDKVEFLVDGSLVSTETIAPYAICSDSNGDYLPCYPSSFPIGSITIEAKSYDASGTETDSITISLTILDSLPPVLDDFFLVNADTDTQVRTLVEGETLDVGTLGYSYNIEATTVATSIAQVEFLVDGSLVQTETSPPFAICADSNGDYVPCPSNHFPYGSITIEAKAYDGSGTETDSKTINLTILDSSTPTN